MEEYQDEEIKTRSQQLRAYIVGFVDSIMEKEENRDFIMAAAVTGAVSFFRLNPMGMAATTIVPLIIKQVIDQRYKAKETENATSENK